MEEEQQQQTPPEDQEHNVTMPATTPAFFVILQKSQGNGKTDEGILVANRDVSSVAQIVPPGPGKSKAKTFLSADCTSGEITVTLDNNNMWNEFYRCSTEMVLTKQGRRMFPYCRYWITGLDPYLKYILLMDISPVDNNRYKWNGRWWEPGGKSEPHVLGRVFIHPESPSTGQFWMHQPVSFYKLKLTNNTLDQEGHIILHSMHRYLPRLHVVPAEKATEVIQLNGPDVHTFTFPQTEFFAVTAYQNFQITQLKIDCNPFAKGFREGAMMGRPLKDMRPKNTNQGVGSPSSKTQMKLDDLEFRQKIREQIRATDHSGGDLETEAFIAERDFLNFLDPHSELEDIPSVREDDLVSPVPSSFKSISRVASPLNPHGKLNIVIKEEPVDEYDYGMEVGTEGLDVKQESSAEEETDEYSNSDDDYPILERQQRRQSAQYRTAPHSPRKRSLGSPSGVAKAKMLKLDSGKMPVVYLEPCSVPKSIVRTSDLQDNILSLERLRSALVHSTKSTELKPPEYSSPSIGQGASRNDKSKSNHKAECVTTKDKLSSSQVSNVKKTKLPLLLPKASLNETTAVHRISTPSVQSKRGRPRKVTKTGRHTKKSYGKTGIATRNPIETPPPFPDVNPDLEDVDGVLFVAFASKEALDVHTGGGPMKDVTSSFPVLPISNGEKEIIRKIPPLQRQLLVHLKTLRHKQVIHPSLQQVGLKLNSVDPATTIDLKYLGVQLPLPYFTSKSRWDNYGSCAHASGSPFVSRTGKTDDYTKIKGWRDKFSTNSITSPTKHDGSSSESSLKNRSAFCSDKLDEYLENEAKLMENCTGPSSSEPASSIVYQFPTKSTSYVRTLDSVLKKQFALPKSSSYAFKPLTLPSSTNQAKGPRKASAPKLKSVFKPILPSPVTVKEKPRVMKPAKSLSVAAQADVMEVNCVLPGSPQAQLQNQQPTILRPFGLSKAQVKLLDLEECAVWEGKPRTYVTMERADISLTTLLTAQASLKSKPIHKIIRKHAPPCNNEFCRLGCVCASLAHAKRKSTHCRRLGCMFGCSCLKRKVFLVKRGVELKKTTSKKSVQGSLAGEEPLSQSQEEDQEGVEDEGDSEEMKTKKPIMEYTVCDSEPEPPVQSFPIWDKWGENRDLEPIYVPTPACLEHNEVHSPQPAALQQPVKTKSSGASKSARVYTPKPKPADSNENVDPVNIYFDGMMTCARVRLYERKPPKAEPDKEVCTCTSTDCTAKEHDRKTHKEKEDNESEDVSNSRLSEPTSSSKSTGDNGGRTKLIEIISDCSWEQDRKKILNIVSQHMNCKQPQTFKVGSFNIELRSERTSAKERVDSVNSSRVKISMASSQDIELDSENLETRNLDSSVPLKTENVKLSQTSPLREVLEKSHGGKGLPFYTKVTPAGKLIARIKNPNINDLELIQVNGKSYPHARLLLGQMGALHPANRLAAYITGRLRPSLLDISTLSTMISKVASKSTTPTSNSSSMDTAVATMKVAIPAQKKIAPQPSPSSVFTQFVMSKVGILQQKNPGVSLPQPTCGLQNLSTQTTPVMVVTSVASGKHAPVFCTTPSTSSSMAALTTPSLPSTTVGLDTTSPSPDNAVTSVPPFISVNKLVTKDSSLSIPSGLVAVPSTDSTPTLTVTSVTSTKESIVSPPSVLTTPLVKPLSASRVTTPALPVRVFPATNVDSTVATSLVTPANVSTPGSAPSQAAVNTMQLTLKPVPENSVPQSTIQVCSPTVISTGVEKQVGHRLLLIPVQPNSPSVQSVQNGQRPQGQKMILQPIQRPGGVNLFRHPNGQIIQLVPLQQISGSNIQPTAQQVVFHNPGAVMGIRLPLPPKPEVSSSVPAPSVSSSDSPVSISTGSVIGSLSKTNPITPGVTVVSSVPPFLSQTGTLTLRISPATTNSHGSPSDAKIITYSSGGQPLSSPSVMPLHAGSFALLNLPPTTPNQQTNISKPNTDLTCTIPSDLKEQMSSDNHLGHSLEFATGEGKVDKGDTTVSMGQQILEPLKTENLSALQDLSPDKSVKSPTTVEQKDTTACLDEMCDEESPLDNKEARTEQSQKTVVPADNIVNSEAMDGTQLQGPVNTKAQNLVEIKSACDTKLTELAARAATEEQNILSESGQKATKASIFEQSPTSCISESEDLLSTSLTSKNIATGERKVSSPDFIDLSFDNEDEREIDDTPSDSPSEYSVDAENSEGEEAVDIETVEELSEKINIARLKATASSGLSSKQTCSVHVTSEGGHGKCGKKNVGKTKEGEANAYYRRNHTANERRRRNEMRDLFDELKHALGLHNLPKVSKCYILRQAFDEIQALTEQADTLIQKKSLLSQKQNLLIRKVSTLSGKTREVVMKKLEYMYAKQKALEAQKKGDNLEGNMVLNTTSLTTSLRQQKEPFREEEAPVFTGKRRRKPLILARKPGLRPLEPKGPLPGVSLTATNLLMTPQGQLVTLKNPPMEGQVAATVLQTDVSPQGAVQPGMSSVLIQLPGTLHVVGNTAIPINLSAVPDTAVAAVVPPTPESEKEDLSMMPKIVNVTSLANEAAMDIGEDFGLSTTMVQEASKTDLQKPLTPETTMGETTPDQGATDHDCDAGSSLPVPLNNTEQSILELPNATQETSDSSLVENFPLGDFSSSKKEAASGSEQFGWKDPLLWKVAAKDVKESSLELELNKVASAMEEAVLNPRELIDSNEDDDQTDENLTSLLNEIAFLNQQLNNDTDDLDSSSDFAGSDTESQASTSKLTDGDESPFSFGRFKDLTEIKEKSLSFSPLFLQLEEGEVPDSSKQNEEAGIMKFVGNNKEILPSSNRKSGGRQQVTGNVSPHQRLTEQETAGADALWKPMPKLAPLGLKAASSSGQQSVQGSKAMPSLAPVSMRLCPLKTTPLTEEQSRLGSKPITVSPGTETQSATSPLPSKTAEK
ncbi:hypothetical protein FKM82_016599 [Ascaphus truei]